MKLHALMIAVALVGGTAFAQAPNGSAKAPADTTTSTPAATSSSTGTNAAGSSRMAATDMDHTAKPATQSHKTVAKKHHAAKHASTQHHAHVASTKHHEQHASAAHHQKVAAADHHHAVHARSSSHTMHAAAHHDTRTMGAGAPRAATDLNASSRQDRMDQAYADWQARR
jgi:hypothetical protein